MHKIRHLNLVEMIKRRAGTLKTRARDWPESFALAARDKTLRARITCATDSDGRLTHFEVIRDVRCALWRE